MTDTDNAADELCSDCETPMGDDGVSCACYCTECERWYVDCECCAECGSTSYHDCDCAEIEQ